MNKQAALDAYEAWKKKHLRGVAADGTSTHVPLMMIDAAQPASPSIHSATFPDALQEQLDKAQRSRDAELSRRWRNLPPLGSE